LATDSAGSVDVALHALDWFEAEFGPVDGLMLLQPTSPFRTLSSIQKAVAEFIRLGGRSVVSFSPAPIHPAWCFSLDGGKLQPLLGWEAVQMSAQKLPPAYMLNGAIYLVRPELLRKEHRFIDENSYPLIMEDPIEGLDIDTPFDMGLARKFCN
ncbi:MAG: acylneuraminate cytidylyltransferase family protein, partial [Burkholderiales bacterium]